MKNIKLLIAGVLLVFAFKDELTNFIPDVIKPQTISVNVNKPDQTFIDFSKEFVSDIKDSKDLYELSVMNDEAATRVVSYTYASVSDIIDIYTKVQKDVFSDKYVGKYPSYKQGLISIFKDVAGESERLLCEEDLFRLSGLLRGLSWNLANKLSSK